MNNLLQKFYDTFDIKPYCRCSDNFVYSSPLEYECTNGDESECLSCEKGIKTYPEITPMVILRLISQINRYKSYHSEYKQELQGQTIHDIKIEVLQECINLKDYFKEMIPNILNLENYIEK